MVIEYKSEIVRMSQLATSLGDDSRTKEIDNEEERREAAYNKLGTLGVNVPAFLKMRLFVQQLEELYESLDKLVQQHDSSGKRAHLGIKMKATMRF